MAKGVALRLGAAGLTIALGGCAGDSGSSLESNMIGQTFTGVGIVTTRRQEPIEYRPRSPLVLPSRYELRRPEDPYQVEAQAAAWPKDPDVARRQAKSNTEAMSIEERRHARDGDEAGQLLTPEEIARGRRQERGDKVTVQPGPASAAGRDWGVLMPNEYQSRKSAEQKQYEAAMEAGVEPPRRYLTEPPVGYRSRVPAKDAKDGPPAPAAAAETAEKPWYKRMWPFGS